MRKFTKSGGVMIPPNIKQMNVMKLYLVLISFMTLSFSSAFATNSEEPRVVSGQVTTPNDPDGLPGANILIKGTDRGTVTDIQGNYMLEVDSEDAVLVFSSIGFEIQEVVVGSQSVINISMVPDITALEEIIVVGYGTQKKATLTGSIETVGDEVFEDRATSNTAALLQGQTPGLLVTRGSAQPGREDWDFQIRGATSVNGGDPLIIIDGQPALDKESFFSMNANDIESVSVLKDGAAAIYGSRASNGVILVTTKKGSGKIKVEFGSNFRLNTKGIQPPNATMQEYATVWLEGVDQDRVPNYWGWQSRENLEDMRNGVAKVYDTRYWGMMYAENSPRSAEMWENSISNQQQLSISGSSEKARYRISAGYMEDRGLLKTAYDGKKQYNLRINTDFDISDRLNFETSISYLHTDISNPSGGLDITAIANDPPFFPTYNPQGQVYANFGVGDKNAVAKSMLGGRETDKINQLRTMFGATFKITEDLSIRATASLDGAFNDGQKYTIKVPTYTWDGTQISNINNNPYIEQEKEHKLYQVYGGFLNYTKTVGDHDFSAMLGVTGEKWQNSKTYGYRDGFVDYGIYDLNIGGTDGTVKANGGQGNWGLFSYIGRFNYNYKGKYLLELSARRDGSSRFAEDFRWSNFGNASVGWVLSEESFMQALPVISFLKLRASYGSTGNQIGIAEHDYISTISTGSAVFGTTPGAFQNTAKVSGITSTQRTWERVGIGTIGVDFEFFNSKLFGSFDYYQKTNDQMLIAINYPQTLGGDAPKTNSGELVTKGWEAILGYRNNNGEFKYNIAFNMGNSTNELVSMEGVSTYNAGKNDRVQGYPLNSYFLYQTDGFFTSDEEVDDYYAEVGNGGTIPSYDNDSQRLRPGDTKKLDLDGDGSITSVGNVDEMNGDIKYSGDADIHLNYGMNFSGAYKGFDFGMFFQGVLNQNVIRTGHNRYPFYLIWTNLNNQYIGKTWTEQNTGAEYPRMTVTTNTARWNWGDTDRMLLNNRYLRLKTLTVGYTISPSVLEKIKVDRLRIYFSANDVFEITSISDGFDPEYGESSNEPYPFKRTWSLGLNLTF